MTPTPAAATQASNLDNNSGAETSDEQALTNYARAAGNYDGDAARVRRRQPDPHRRGPGDPQVGRRRHDRPGRHQRVDAQPADLRVPLRRRPARDRHPPRRPLPAGRRELRDDSARGERRVRPGGRPEPIVGLHERHREQRTAAGRSSGTHSTVSAARADGPSANFDITLPHPHAGLLPGELRRRRSGPHPRLLGQRRVGAWGGLRHLRARRSRLHGRGHAGSTPTRPTGSTTSTCRAPARRRAASRSTSAWPAAGEPGELRGRRPTSTARRRSMDPATASAGRCAWTSRASSTPACPRSPTSCRSGTVYEAGSAVATAANNVTSTLDATQAGVLIWDLGTTVDSGGLVFEWRFSTIVTKDSSSTSGDVPGNLMKFAYANSAGTTFPLRDQVDFERDEAELSLLKGVRDVNNVPAGGHPANTDNREVQGGDTVTYRVDITNDGARDAEDIEVWDDLPAGIDCSVLTVLNISDGGTCNTVPDRIEWSGLTLAAGASDTLTYDLVIPAAVSPGQTLTNTAGVRSYTSDTNIGGSFLYIPESNIDPALTSRRQRGARRRRLERVHRPGRRSSRRARPRSPGRATTRGRGDDRRGDHLHPHGDDSPGDDDLRLADADRRARHSSHLHRGQRGRHAQRREPAHGRADPDRVGQPTTIGVAFPSSYTNAAGSGDDVLVVTFKAKLADVATNFRAGAPRCPTRARWPGTTRTQPRAPCRAASSTNVSEPVLSLAKDENDADDAVDPGQIIHYIVTASNGSAVRTSTAHDLIAVDTLPLGVTPVNAGVAGGRRRNGRARPRDLELRRAHDHLERHEPRARRQRRARLRRAGRRPRGRRHDLPQLRHPHRNEPARRRRRRRRRARPAPAPAPPATSPRPRTSCASAPRRSRRRSPRPRPRSARSGSSPSTP